MLGWLLLVFSLLAGAFVYLRQDAVALALQTNGDSIYLLIGGLVVLFWMVSVASSGQRGRLGQVVRHLAIWAGLFLSLVAGYAYRDELSAVAYRIAGELMPPGQTIVEPGEAGERAVRIRRRGDGHFMARTDVNGVQTVMLVDTGASTVVLKPADAEKIGIDTKRLAYTVPVQTANGTTYAAPVRLRIIGIGPIQVREVEALVSKPGSLKESLLGISFLRRLRSYEFSGDFLTLRI